jgi:hypothetical protein
MIPIIEKTLDLGVHTVSSCEYPAFRLFRILELNRMSDPLCGLFFRPVSKYRLERVSSIDLTLFLSVAALSMFRIRILVD